MHPARWILLTVGAAIAAGVVPGRAAPPLAAGFATPLLAPVDEPFPFARVRVTPAQLPDALKQLDPGVLVRMPREDFEARVRKAGRAVAASRAVPRLLKAEYAATFDGSDLRGTAVWTILNPGPLPAALPLDPFRLAVRSATWADGREAVVGVLGPSFPPGPAVWVEGTGQQVLTFEWSAAGSPGGGDRQFDIRVPSCPRATLTLNLSADRAPAVTSPDVLLTGPEAVDAKRRAWRLRFGGQSRLEFGVQASGETAPAGPVLASLTARYDLTAGQVTGVFDYDLRPTRGTVGEWVFALDPGLRVTDVVVNNRSGLRTDAATRLLHVTVRPPGTGGKVQITAVAPLPAGVTAPLPMIRPVGAVVGEERIEVRVQPDVRPESWDAGDYRLTDATVGADHARVLNLVGSLLPVGVDLASRRPPSLRVSGSGSEFTTAEGVEWRTEGGRQWITTRVVVSVRRGPLFQIRFRAPPEFTLDRVTAKPDDLVFPARGPEPVIEFARPVIAGQRVELLLEFRGPPVPTTPARVPFPRVVPVGAAEREGWVRLRPGPGWSVAPDPQPGADRATEFDFPEPPLPASDGAVTYLFWGIEPGGQFLLTPVRPAFTTDSVTRLDSIGDRLTASTRIELRIEAGELPGVTVFEPGPPHPGRTWALVGDGSNAVVAMPLFLFLGELPEALPLLAAPWGELPAVLSARAALTSGPGTYWAIRFARPATGTLVLETTAAVSPVLKLDEARARAGELAAGQPGLPVVRGAARSVARVELAPGLGGERPATGTGSPRTWAFAGLYAVTVATAEGPSLVVFGGSVTASSGGVLPIRLPPGAEVRAAAVGGHWLDPGKCATGAGTSELRLPIPVESGPVRFEIRHRLPAMNGQALRWVPGAIPELPDGPHAIRREWVFPQAVLPAWPFAVKDRHTAADLPALLGEPVDRLGMTVSSFPGDAVVVVPARLADAVGAGLAAVIVGLGWLGLRRAHRSIGFAILVSLLGTGVAVLLGPVAWERAALPPLVAGLLVVAAMVLARAWHGRAARVPAVVAALCLLPLFALHAEPLGRDVVFILAGPADDPTRETVLAPKSLLDKLDAATTLPRPGAVITAAEYAGQVDAGTARVTAKFVVHAFADGEPTLTLPLADARLERVTVGGKQAHPVAVRPDLYTIPLPGRGRHEVEVRFAVPVTLVGPDREVRFGIPDVPASRLSLVLPKSAQQPQAVGAVGGQRITTEGDAPRLETELGGGRTAQVRWRQGADGKAVVTVREGCVWDVAESGAELTACYQVRIEQGSVSELRFDLPRDLEPVRVTARRLDGPIGAAILRGWVAEPPNGDRRPLRIDLQGPTDGRLLVTLVCVPRSAPTRQPTLRFPEVVGADRQAAVHGLRATKVAVEGVNFGGVIDYDPESLFREFGAVADLRLDPAVQVRTFGPEAGKTPWLRPVLRPGPEPWTAAQEVTWRIGPHRADAAGVVRWTKEPPAVLEFDLPETRLFGVRVPRVRVLEVRGPEVFGWSQTGGRVQVWLRKAGRDGAIEWVGIAEPVPTGHAILQPFAFEAVLPRLVGAGASSEILRVIPADGWAVRVERDRGWKRVSPGADAEWVFRADGSPPPVRLSLSRPR